MDDSKDVRNEVINQQSVNGQTIGNNNTIYNRFYGPVHDTSAPTEADSEREQLLRRLEVRYRRDLRSSLNGIDKKELKLTILPKTFWKSAPVIQQANSLTTPLPSSTSIIKTYNDVGQELLIVGEAGAGKSTLLFMLGQYLVNRAKQDDTQPLPFIVNLSTWAIRKLPIQEWISETLIEDHQVRLRQEWFTNNKILLLLDGLDEVEMESLPTCITAINEYLLDRARPLVVCCRTGAYAATPAQHRLNLHSVMIQSLTPEQVNESLNRVGEPFASLKKAFNEDHVMIEILSNPLMLRYLLHIDPKPILQQLAQSTGQSDSEQVTRLKLQIVENYVQKQIGETSMSSPHTTQQIQSGLALLAQKMRDHNQTTFYVEHLQSDWLPTERLSFLYDQLATRGIGFLLGFLMGLSINAVIFGGDKIALDILYALLGGLIGSLISGGDSLGFRFFTILDTLKSQWPRLVLLGLLNAFLVGAVVYLAFLIQPTDGYHEELIYGCGTGTASFFLTLTILAGKAPDAQNIIPSHTFLQRLWKRIPPQGLKTDYYKLGTIVGLIVGLSVGISVGLSGEISNGYGKNVGLSSGISNGLSTGLTIGLSYAAIGIMLCIPLLGKKATIKVADQLKWSLKNFVRQLINKEHFSITIRLFLFILCFFGLGIGIGIGLFTGWDAGVKNGLIFGLSAALSVSSAYWVLFALWIRGVYSITIEDDIRIIPNQGIRSSLQTAFKIFIYGSILCIIIGLSNEILYYSLDYGFSKGVYEGFKALWRDALFIECFGALLPALFIGGITVIRHYLLRILLRFSGVLPLDIVRFLDDATSRDLLHRDVSSGGYRFTHNYIFDHFANHDRQNDQR